MPLMTVNEMGLPPAAAIIVMLDHGQPGNLARRNWWPDGDTLGLCGGNRQSSRGVAQPFGRHHPRTPALATAGAGRRNTLTGTLSDQVAFHLGECRLDLQKGAAGIVVSKGICVAA
jgi:hypothetical protein